ncbi:DUF6115 domain-containing protein [Paenibacillus soyae]|uniref:Uncharacterized protein n=1 Tax=Paenibacillus soyae TaxID=2969249 RepID=A0A9X2S9E1_9BACL|nr:hypothetical protein [Paenibacillus soyae]MCR2805040.1 hypothetical protein [Paenibacillus soyae]
MDPWQTVVLVGAVVIMVAFFMPKKKPEADQSTQSVRNMETALDQFMENMEKDNDQIMKLVAEAQKTSKQEAEKKDERIASLEQRCGQLEKLLQDSVVGPALAAAQPQPRRVLSQAAQLEASSVGYGELGGQGQPAASQAVPEEDAWSAGQSPEAEKESAAKSNSIHARYAELFQLHGEGKSVEAIAKKLGMNKGEVQLIIGLSKQEEAAHV